jgi:1,4-alpha-glucan branching enzyme
MRSTADPEAVAAICGGYHSSPFDVLGIHPVDIDGQPAVAVRAFDPQAREVVVQPSEGGQAPRPMAQLRPDGFFEAVFPHCTQTFRYTLLVTTHRGTTYELEDPYRFLPVLSDFDLHLFSEGNYYRIYAHLGAHLRELEGVPGVSFAVWAPNAERVSVVGPFNEWDGRRHPMRPRGATGVWELFIPGLQEWVLYKYEIRSRRQGYISLRADPVGFATELRPKSASLVFELGRYQWGDGEWMQRRKTANALDAAISIYEVHLGSWRRTRDNRWLTYRELADELVPYVQDMGYTHIELLPITEYLLDRSWGYQTTGYFAPTSRYGTPDELRLLIDRCHQAGIGVILDWVPSHFPKDETALGFFDGTHLYEHADPRKGEHRDWGTYSFNYDRTEVCEFLISSAMFWLDQYHVDGLRVDAVASMIYLDYSREDGEWLPNEFGGRENLGAIRFLKRFNELVHQEYPDILTIAEESTAWPMVSRPTYLGGLGFDLKWNMGWMHDMLLYMRKDPIYRRYHQNNLTFSLLYAFTENFVLPLSHDEVVHMKGSLLSKMPGDDWQKFANLRALYAYMFGHPGKKLNFMGSEFGQWSEWNYDQSLDWYLLEYERHQELQRFVRDVNHLYTAEPALYQVDFSWEGFEWIDFHDVNSSTVSFIRKGSGDVAPIIVVANFTPVPRIGYRVGLPRPGFYRELLNTDGVEYGGSGVGNMGGVMAQDVAWQGQPYSAMLSLPPLGVLFLKPQDGRNAWYEEQGACASPA